MPALKYLKISLWLMLIAPFWTGPAAAETLYYYQKSFRYSYHRALLEAVLAATRDDYGKADMRAYPLIGEEVSEGRGEELLQQGKIDVVYLSTSVARERRFRPVRVPLLRGLLGVRLFLLSQPEQPRLRQVTTLEELTRSFTVGFHRQWADFAIYPANGFRMVNTVRYETLFAMLAKKRFDLFPRGVNEIWGELSHFSPRYPTLAVEQSLALYYPYPVYFFVKKDNEALANRLREGLERLLHNGRFRQLFLQYHGEAVRLARLSERRIFCLDNPTLPKATPPLDLSWWLTASGKRSDDLCSGRRRSLSATK